MTTARERRRKHREDDRYLQKAINAVKKTEELIDAVKKMLALLISAFPLGVALAITAKGAWKEIIEAFMK